MNRKIVSGCILSTTLLILLSIAPSINAYNIPKIDKEKYMEFITEGDWYPGYWLTVFFVYIVFCMFFILDFILYKIDSTTFYSNNLEKT